MSSKACTPDQGMKQRLMPRDDTAIPFSEIESVGLSRSHTIGPTTQKRSGRPIINSKLTPSPVLTIWEIDTANRKEPGKNMTAHARHAATKDRTE
jgi:hypothetical protein